MQWTVLSQNGERNNIGLYHGSESGHVLIHCNQQIMTIDFNVYETKTYNFFLNEELYELEIEKTSDDVFAYGLKVNDEVKTPFNEKKLEKEKKEVNYIVMGIIGFFVLLIFLAFILYSTSNL